MKHNASKQMLKRLLCLFILTLILIPIILEAGKVSVSGYYRKDGTYVRPHYRTSPDGNPYNNYSFPGNYNPNTGKISTGDPEKYLERYYNRKRSYASSSIPSIPSVAPDPSVASELTYNEAIQSALSILGYKVGLVDGIIGPRTQLAIISFQIDQDLEPDGIVGPLTLKALSNALSR